MSKAMALLQNIAGGGLIMSPSGADLMRPFTGPLMHKFFVGKEGSSPEQRPRMFSLVRDLTASDSAGDDTMATLPGGGSLAAQKQAILRGYKQSRAKLMAWRAAGLGE